MKQGGRLGAAHSNGKYNENETYLFPFSHRSHIIYFFACGWTELLASQIYPAASKNLVVNPSPLQKHTKNPVVTLDHYYRGFSMFL